MAVIVEVLGREILEGDVRKAHAESNDASSGGGARDYRFPIAYKPVLDRLFSRGHEEHSRTDYMVSDFVCVDMNGRESIERDVKYAYTPTSSRPTEVRLAQASSHEFFKNVPETDPANGVLFLVLIRMSEGLPRAMYTTQASLTSAESDQTIAAAVKDAIGSRKSASSAVIFTARIGR